MLSDPQLHYLDNAATSRVDPAVAQAPAVVVGSGLRRSKLIVPGAVLPDLPGAEAVDGLGR